jgi:hypothetical protein
MEYLNKEGQFDCTVTLPTAGWIGEQGDRQTPFIRIPVVVSEGTEVGKGAVWQGWLSNNAFEGTIKRLAEVFGFNGDLASLATGKTTLAGKACSIITEFEEYEGKRRLKIKWLNAHGGGGAKPMDLNRLNALLGALNKRAMAVAAMASDKSGTKLADAVDEDSQYPF